MYAKIRMMPEYLQMANNLNLELSMEYFGESEAAMVTLVYSSSTNWCYLGSSLLCFSVLKHTVAK